MTGSAGTEPDGIGRARLPRRDWILLPAIALVTLLLMAGLSEATARYLFRASASSTMSCLIATDPATGVRGIPNSFCRQKIFESGMIDYRFNDCGFRTRQSCGPKPAGLYRIVLIGSSMAYGMHIPQEQSFAGKLGPMLSRRAGRPVEIFNEAMQWGTPASLALRTDAMLAAKPDMILWTLTPFDVTNAGLVLPYIPRVQRAVVQEQAGGSRGATAAMVPHGLATLPGRAWDRLIRELNQTRSVFMFQHLLFRSESQYLAHSLAQGDEVDYLRKLPSAALADNLAIFAESLDRVAAAARAAHVPLVVTLLPSRPQSIMLVERTWQPGYDPNELMRLLAPLVRSRGARYVDMTVGLADVPQAGQLYFPVDGHLPAEGHAMLTKLLGDALLRSGAIPAVTARVR